MVDLSCAPGFFDGRGGIQPTVYFFNPVPLQDGFFNEPALRGSWRIDWWRMDVKGEIGSFLEGKLFVRDRTESWTWNRVRDWSRSWS